MKKTLEKRLAFEQLEHRELLAANIFQQGAAAINQLAKNGAAAHQEVSHTLQTTLKTLNDNLVAVSKDLSRNSIELANAQRSKNATAIQKEQQDQAQIIKDLNQISADIASAAKAAASAHVAIDKETSARILDVVHAEQNAQRTHASTIDVQPILDQDLNDFATLQAAGSAKVNDLLANASAAKSNADSLVTV